MDDAEKTGADEASSGSSAKKRTRTRTRSVTRTRKPKSTPATETAAPELPLETAAPEQRAPEPERTPEPVREVVSEKPVERPRFTPEPREEPAPAPAPEPEARVPAEPATPAPSDDRSAPERSGGPEQRHPQQSGGQPRQFHGEQGGGGNEPFWKRDKRNKRKRGKHGGGQWQQGGGGGEPRHPAQPPPPNLQPVYGDLPGPDRFNDLAALKTRADEITVGGGEPINIEKVYGLNLGDLTAEARRLGVTFEGAPNRKQLLSQIFKSAAEAKRPIVDRGWLDLTDRGHGFIVHEAVNYRLYPENSYVPESLIRQYGLKRGHLLEVQAEAPRENERCPSVVRVKSAMGIAPEEISKVKPFEDLVPYYPLKRILLEAPEVHKDVSMRAVDILTPIGFGQRGLIVAPPRTGKTVLLQNMANSISENFPEAKLILLLIDERPEEVTDFRRHTRGEVVSSTFDEAPESHVHCAEMVGEKARRLVEMGQHVIILLDSITRLARAYNALASNSGKIMSGGMEATAMQKPKRFFGAARNIEGGGSLTIMATALIDTGSRMDEVIFEEFKGTGNMELHLDRGLVDKRIFPAINMDRSGTRKEELIYHPDEMVRIYGLRRAMQGIPPIEAMEMLLNRLKKTKTNAEFLMSLNR
ncbi:transcription termination factor Rho [Opitutaceae bacterium EW11]|nr:transcription termination factor Rho [Opitutaceae bacterium EW11]